MDQSRISVDTEALRGAAEKVDKSVSDIQANIQKFQSVIEGLNNTWSSDVKNKFFTSYEKDLKALNEMVSQYSEVSSGLRTIADYHQKNEETIKSHIDKAQRTYG